MTTKITNVIKVSLAHLGEEELEEVRSAFEYGYFGLAYNVDEFETQVGKYIGAKHVVATNTGTSALHVAIDVLGLQPGDEVIVPSLTFVASFQAITAVGAIPVPCDVDADTLCMDPKDVEKRITSKTKVLMPIHYGGYPCDMSALMDLKEKHELRIIEDAAHAFGSTYKGKMIGSFGDITCFSFGSQKNITCAECRGAAAAVGGCAYRSGARPGLCLCLSGQSGAAAGNGRRADFLLAADRRDTAGGGQCVSARRLSRAARRYAGWQ